MAKKETTKTKKTKKAVDPKTAILEKAKAARAAARENPQESITKDILMRETAQKLGITKEDVQIVIDAFLDIAGTGLARGAKVSIHGFGIFNTIQVSARDGINPLTKEPMHIPESTRVTFKAASALKSLVNE